MCSGDKESWSTTDSESDTDSDLPDEAHIIRCTRDPQVARRYTMQYSVVPTIPIK